MSSLSEDFSYRARDLYWESPGLQSAYSLAALTRARAAEMGGFLDAALASYCNAARRVRSLELRRSRLQDFARFVATHVTAREPHHLNDNLFVRHLLSSSEGARIRKLIRGMPPPERVSLRKNLIVLKAPAANERGVLLLKYTPHFQTFLMNFDLQRVCERFSLVLEPSWYPYPEPFWAQFICRSTLVVCQTISRTATEDMQNCKLPLVPVPIGAQDWVNPKVFFPIPGTKKDFDVVMIASFMKLKRHHVLFEAMRTMRPRIKVALIGRTWGRDRKQFEEQVRNAGVADDVTIFQGLKGPEINEVLNRSKVNLLLSKMEGGNVALMEAMAAGVPCVVYKDIIGPRLTDINAQTGMLATDEELPIVLGEAIEGHARFRPREWFMRNTGPGNATRALDSGLREASLQRGEAYTRSIVPKENRLGLCYVNQEDERSMEAGWRELEQALVSLG